MVISEFRNTAEIALSRRVSLWRRFFIYYVVCPFFFSQHNRKNFPSFSCSIRPKDFKNECCRRSLSIESCEKYINGKIGERTTRNSGTYQIGISSKNLNSSCGCSLRWREPRHCLQQYLNRVRPAQGQFTLHHPTALLAYLIRSQLDSPLSAVPSSRLCDRPTTASSSVRSTCCCRIQRFKQRVHDDVLAIKHMISRFGATEAIPRC